MHVSKAVIRHTELIKNRSSDDRVHVWQEEKLGVRENQKQGCQGSKVARNHLPNLGVFLSVVRRKSFKVRSDRIWIFNCKRSPCLLLWRAKCVSSVPRIVPTG